jgi:hypothetical protein
MSRTIARLTTIPAAPAMPCRNRNANRYYYWMAKTQTASQCFTAPWAIETGTIYDSDDFGSRWYGYGWPMRVPATEAQPPK